MKKSVKGLFVASVIAAAVAAPAHAELSANIGMVSDYHFRGIDQGSGATASAGIDYSHDLGVYVGTWVADVTTGIEYDLYAGYAGEFSGVSVDVGYFTYNYTNDVFDDTYAEVSASVGFGPVSLQYAMGTYDNYGTALDYTFTGITGEYQGFYATYGSHGKDFDGSYIELGYGTEVGGFDTGIAVISADSTLAPTLDVNNTVQGDVSVVFSLGKSFDL